MLKIVFIFSALLVVTQQLQAADFKKALEQTLKNEGGYVNNLIDKGGETYRGIARHIHPKWEGWITVDKVKLQLGYKNTINCSAKIRRAIDKSLAKEQGLAILIEIFYKKEFWDPLNLDSEPSQMIANQEFDTAVNLGLSVTKQIRQQVNEEIKSTK